MKIFDLDSISGLEDEVQPSDVADALDRDGAVMFTRDDEPYALLKPVDPWAGIPDVKAIPETSVAVMNFIRAADEAGVGITILRSGEDWTVGYVTAAGGGDLTTAPTIAEAATAAVFALAQRDS